MTAWLTQHYLETKALFFFAKFTASIMETVDCVDSFTGSTPALLLLFFRR